MKLIGTLSSSEELDQELGWFFLTFPPDISYYYNWFYVKTGHKPWKQCLNGPHVTFIFGKHENRIVLSREVGSLLGAKVIVHYYPEIRTNGRAFWMPVYSPTLLYIRDRLGLGRVRNQLHLTLGNYK
jgi:hypothetical protein